MKVKGIERRRGRAGIRARSACVVEIISLGLFALSCQKEHAAPTSKEPAANVLANQKERAALGGTVPSKEPAAPLNPAPLKEGEVRAGVAEPSALPPERIWGRADLDTENDDVVAPPDAVPDCHALLDAAGLKYRKAELPLKQIVRDVPTCGCHDAVTVTHTPMGMKLAPPAVVSCQMALALVRLEVVIQELALAHLGERVRTLHQGGTYSCRKMARFDLVSEHSYGNAIDVFSFTLESGKKVSVLSDFGDLGVDTETLPSKGKFLRNLASAVYDRDLMSVSLSPYWDALHRDHFHFDMARYRVDGSRRR